MKGRFDQRVAVVTGAASGIGAATARLLAEEGATVIVCDVQHDAGTALAAEIGAGDAFGVRGVCSVSAPLDLAACSRQLEAPSNYIYQTRFVRSMKEKMRERQRLMPDVFQFNGVLGGIRTVWDLDDKITAKFFGFGSAENYYRTQSSIACLNKIAVPALLVASKDDPLVPFEIYRHASLDDNPNIRLVATDHGGHVSFLARQHPRFWLDDTIIEWMEQVRS